MSYEIRMKANITNTRSGISELSQTGNYGGMECGE